MTEKDLDDMDEIKQPGKEKSPQLHDEKHEWGDEEFSFDSIWNRLPHISFYQEWANFRRKFYLNAGNY